MEAMSQGLYIPRPDLNDPVGLECEITFVNALKDSLEPTDPNYAGDCAFYGGQLSNLMDRLAQASSAGQSPSDDYDTPASSTELSDVSRKRPRELSVSGSSDYLYSYRPDSPRSSMAIESMPGNSSTWKRPRSDIPQFSNDVIDFSNDGYQIPPLRSYQPQNFAPSDPFPELFHAYQPQPVRARNQPADAFVQDTMTIDELARFISSPAPARSGYTYNPPALAWQNALPPQPRPSQLELPDPRLGYQNLVDWRMHSPMLSPAAAGEPEVVNNLIDSIKCQDNDKLNREPTPRTMSCTLMPHQEQALAWLLNMERGSNRGSILADEMGLGKTIEGLSLILANPSRNPSRKTTLIIAPLALLRQWEKEIERHVKPAHRLSVYVYHQQGKRTDFSRLREYDIVLTTFGSLGSEQKSIDMRKDSEANDRERRDPAFTRKAAQKLGLLGPECYWYRVILDEAQYIKNRRTQTSRGAASLQAEFRLCMSGTPMQNSIEELYPLIRFLRIPSYMEWASFRDKFSNPINGKGTTDYRRDQSMQRLQALIKSIMLRREKTTMIDGKPICDLPPKYINMTSVEFSNAEREIYKAVETKSQLKLNLYLKRGTVSNNYANILVMLLRLRQICCHPHLVSDLGVQVSTDGIAEDDLKSRAKELPKDVIRRLSEADNFECPICYETELNPTIIVPCGHYCCGECFQKLVEQVRIAQDENGRAACPNCRGTLSSDRITDFRHFCMVFCPQKYDELCRELNGSGEHDLEDEEEDNSDGNSEDEEEDDEDANDPTLGGFIVDDDENDDDVSMAGESGFVSDDPDATAVTDRKSNGKNKKGKGKKKDKGKSKAKEPMTLAQLKKMSLRNAHAKAKYLKRLRKNFKSSAKIDKTMEILASIKQNDPTEKTLIFSSFTTLLDLLEVALQKEKYTYLRYDGSMKFDDRVDAVNTFMDSATDNIMLISIKAGNAGLNLNKASQVIMMDPFWNPFVEDQAVDRAHRMPQQREVHVHRVLVPETVEDRICKLQDDKRDMINTALDERAGKSLTRLSINELRNLFGL